jgi:hypothetical protein
MKIATPSGTTFTMIDDLVTITRHDQPEITVPIDDIEEFYKEYFDEDIDLEDDL